MDVTKPYNVIGFGAIGVTKHYEIIGFGAMDVTKPYKFIGFGGHGCHQRRQNYPSFRMGYENFKLCFGPRPKL